MASYNYKEKAVKVTRREFLQVAGLAGAVLWTGAYVTTDLFVDRTKYIKLRAKAIYQDDAKSKVRQSHNNEALQAMYKNFAGNPLSELSEELFHTKYHARTAVI